MAGWRTLIVTSDARLRVRHGALHLERADGQMSLPIEDLDIVLLETPRGSISHDALRALAQAGVPLLVVDERHTPCGVLLPYNQNPRISTLLNAQMEISEPFKKRVWQQIVQRKIENSAACLDQLARPGGDKLREIAKTVRSGDTTGREAYAAREYFKAVSPGFLRRSDSPASAALDYGYAVIRALVARSLSSRGLQCALGIGHRSSTNPFNLADDFVEVFRPFVDLIVFKDPPQQSLSPEDRLRLISVVRLECSIDHSVYSLSTASNEVADSYARAVTERDYRRIRLPQLSCYALRTFE